MMRPHWTLLLAAALAVPLATNSQSALAQQAGQPGAGVPSYAKNAGNNAAAQAQGAQAQAQIARQQRPVPAQAAQPFAPLNDAQQAQLQQLLLAWQQQSQGTRTLDCKFQRWHYDNLAAPVGIHATRADGVIKYAAPDKGVFRVDSLVFYKGMKEGKPVFEPQAGLFGEHWVCNGKQLIEMDRSQKQCKIQDLPADMQGQQIFNSPLPFVFNLDAAEIQRRYWVRQVAAPNDKIVLIEAWPKRQDDRAQYKMVQIALEKETFLPQALIMYAPNFHAQNAPKWDHYEFVDMKRNGVGNAIANFMDNFIQERPPADWTIFRDTFNPNAEPEAQQAANPNGGQIK
ncbi:TIGR03009 domain-containing protein [Novipirellula sp. SH528]|uniref:TIGR03009 domain-containing protein n=1 Tax=Novipirellula sp. SH528 TaxID=3454466 RepID=UPI003F9FFA13